MKTLQQLYDEYEGDLIDAMINRFKLSGKKDIVFRSRFIKANDGCLHQPLADRSKKHLIDEFQDVGQIYRQTLASICDKLKWDVQPAKARIGGKFAVPGCRRKCLNNGQNNRV